MNNLFDLSGKVALVTGGNSGIGLGIAKGLAQAGADVCIWGRNDKKNNEAVKLLGEAGTKVEAIACDVGNEAGVVDAFAETLKRMGKVDSCFANSGTAGAAPFTSMSSEEWHRVLRVNLDGAFYTFRAAAKHMVERGEGGSLVGTSSLAAFEGQPRGEHYAATKGGLISMLKAMAVEFARNGIRANAIVPGWIESGMTDAIFKWEKFAQAVMPRIPMRRWGTGDDFAGLAVYLASDASRYHTGDTMIIDGGYSVF